MGYQSKVWDAKGSGDSVENNADALIFRTAICFWAKTNSYEGRWETAYTVFLLPFRDKTLRNEDFYERKNCFN